MTPRQLRDAANSPWPGEPCNCSPPWQVAGVVLWKCPKCGDEWHHRPFPAPNGGVTPTHWERVPLTTPPPPKPTRERRLRDRLWENAEAMLKLHRYQKLLDGNWYIEPSDD